MKERKIAEGETSWEKLKADIASDKGVIFPHEKNQLLMRFINQIEDDE